MTDDDHATAAATEEARKQKEAEFLASYDPHQYPPIAVTVDVVLLTVRQGRFSVLLVRRKHPPFEGHWALPGGFVEPDEDLHQAAQRELGEETGFDELPAGMHLEQLRTYGMPHRDPRLRVVSVAHVVFAPDLPPPKAGDDAALARFWAVSELHDANGPALAFDHAQIVAEGIERARAKIEYTPLAAAFLDEPFTLSELRRIYEEVWGVPQDPSNFRRKVLSREGFVEPVGDSSPSRAGLGGRPADLYRRGTANILWPPLRRFEPELEREES
ncbi:MAG: NUDIX domain-containing protein [Candidatus Dormiibacterota bacterium]